MKMLKNYEIKIALLITSGFVIKRAYDLLKYKILQLETRVTKLEHPTEFKDLKNVDEFFNHPPVQIKTK